MSKKSKKYEINTDVIVDLMARYQLAEDMRPDTSEMMASLGVPQRTLYTKVNQRIKEIKEVNHE